MRILIAEDETIIRLDLRELLEKSGFEVVAEARDGEEAIALAQSEEPDLALLDVKMPKLDGIDAARRILDERPIPIVMVTAYGEQELVSRAVEHDHCDVAFLAAQRLGHRRDIVGNRPGDIYDAPGLAAHREGGPGGRKQVALIARVDPGVRLERPTGGGSNRPYPPIRDVDIRRFAAGHDMDAGLAEQHHLRSAHDRLDARAAQTVHRECGHVHGDARLDRGLAGRDLPGAGLQHLAHDHVLDLVAADSGTVEGGLDREAAEVGKDVGRRGVHDGLIERADEEGDHETAEQQPALARVVDQMLAILRHVEVRVRPRFLLRQPLDDVQHRHGAVGLSRQIQRKAERLQGRR